MKIIDNGEDLVEIITSYGSVTSSDIFLDPDYYLVRLVLNINAELGAKVLTLTTLDGMSVQIANKDRVVFYSGTPCDVFDTSEMMLKLFTKLQSYLPEDLF